MNGMATTLSRKLIGLTVKQPWRTASAAHQAHVSTLPPEPVIPSKTPFKVQLVGRKRYYWCSCGYSKKQPFCDGAHRSKGQGLVPLRFVPEKDATAWLCGCKRTKSPPYCDGTHKQDSVVSAPLHA